MMNNDGKYAEKYSLVEGSKYHHHKIPDQENQAISVQKGLVNESKSKMKLFRLVPQCLYFFNLK